MEIGSKLWRKPFQRGRERKSLKERATIKFNKSQNRVKKINLMRKLSKEILPMLISITLDDF